MKHQSCSNCPKSVSTINVYLEIAPELNPMSSFCFTGGVIMCSGDLKFGDFWGICFVEPRKGGF